MNALSEQPDIMQGASSTATPDPAPVDPLALKTNVRQFVVDNFLMGAFELELGDDDSFMEQQVIDSFGVVELVSFIEKTFRVKVNDSDMVPKNLDSVNGIVRYLQHKLDGRI